tara:strand:- start:35228 stop:36562 length:1335 start_codon:yes stop_codon:yes gene_type:complete
MHEPKSSKSFKEWLDHLQQESWQLELVISGFSIFGLISVFEPLSYQFSLAQNLGNTIKANLIMITLASCSILSLNLIIHVILRGLWIGALGLRYVSGDIDFDTLNYYSKFDKFLRKRIGSFDKFIEKLENYCSIIFATSFLMIFYFLAFFICTLLFALLIKFITTSFDAETIALKILGIVLIVIFLISILLTLIDFATLGYLKKKKWLAIIYYPFYRFISLITLSFLYRSLVYNFLDNKLGRRISFILFPLYISVAVFSAVKFESSNYFFNENASSFSQTKPSHYENLIEENKAFVDLASIPSKIITTPYLPIFIEFDDDIEDNIVSFNKDLEIEEETRGLNINFISDTDKNKSFDSLIKNLQPIYLKTLESFFTITIDTSEYKDVEYTFTKNRFKQTGFETVMKITPLKEGKHLLSIDKYINRKDSLIKVSHVKIPFWYYKND